MIMDPLWPTVVALIASMASPLTCTDPIILELPRCSAQAEFSALRPTCTNWKGAYLFSAESRHTILLDNSLGAAKLYVLTHEATHCGLHELRSKYGLRQPGSRDRAEEEIVDNLMYELERRGAFK